MGFPHKSHPKETLVLSTHFGDPEARSLSGWRARGGYRALEQALGMTPADIVAAAGRGFPPASSGRS
jgi:NADH-quinone oxidoreductase subunit F